MSKLDDHLAAYVENAITHGECILSGDYKTGNRAHDAGWKAAKALRASGASGHGRLLTLLDHENIYVRLAAAKDCLDIYEAKAIAVLAEVAKDPGITGFNAEIVVQEWENGNLKLP